MLIVTPGKGFVEADVLEFIEDGGGVLFFVDRGEVNSFKPFIQQTFRRLCLGRGRRASARGRGRKTSIRLPWAVRAASSFSFDSYAWFAFLTPLGRFNDNRTGIAIAEPGQLGPTSGGVVFFGDTWPLTEDGLAAAHNRELVLNSIAYVSPTPASAYRVKLSSGQSVLGRDFGGYQLPSVSGVVWNDTNGNGIRDPGEAGKPGVTVELWFAGPNGQIGGETFAVGGVTLGGNDDVRRATATTDSSGVYHFDNVPLDDYYLRFITTRTSSSVRRTKVE